MRRLLVLFILLIIHLSMFSQDKFTSSVWNFQLDQISEPFIIQDEHNNFTASFDLEDNGLMLLEIMPKDRSCGTDEDCIQNALEIVLDDIRNQDPAAFSDLKKQSTENISKGGYTGIRSIYYNISNYAVIDAYITDGFLYILSITSQQHPERYFSYLDTFSFLEEAKEHGERKMRFEEK